MKKLSILVLLLTNFLCNTVGAQDDYYVPYGRELFNARKNTDRSLWLWESVDVLKHHDKRTALLEFMKNSYEGAPPITVLYLNSNTNFLRSEELREGLIDLISRAHEQGAAVHFLAGHPSWAYQNREVLGIIEAVSTFNNSLPPEARLDGVHFDIEPHTLSMWNTNPGLRKKFFESIKLYSQKMRELNPDIVFAIDVPTFYTKDEIRLLASLTDYLTLMNYTDNGMLMYKRAKRFLEVADELGTKIESGIETQAPSTQWGVTPPITFYDEGRTIMEERLSQAVTLMSKYPSFLGLAVHYYKSYNKLQPERRIIKDTTKYPEQPIIEIPFMQNPVTIDGLLAEKDNAAHVPLRDKQQIVYTIVPGAWDNSTDFSVDAYLGWTEQGVYLAFDVRDDRVVQEFNNDDMVNGDHIEIWFDIDYEGDEWQNWINEDDYQFGFSPGNFKGIAPSVCKWAPIAIDVPDLTNVLFASRKTDYGYTGEMFIPFAQFESFKPEAGTKIRINIDPSDTDGDNNVQEVLISSSIARQYNNPRSFRTAVFVKTE